MAGHNRRHSRGSILSFTIDAVRSLSRVGSRQAIRLEDEDHSNARLPPVSDTPQTCHAGRAPSPSAAGNVAPSDSHVPPDASKTRKPRPLSWLPTSQPMKKKVGRSISAPVLTSTTNAIVARTERVRCGELTQADIVQSTWSPQAGWIPDPSGRAEHIETVPTTTKMSDDFEGGITNDTDGVKTGVEKKKNATLSRIKGIFRGHLDFRSVSRRPSVSDRTQFSKLEESSISSTARKRAENISLCKQKIRNLTGHGNVKRKPIEKHQQLSARTANGRHQEEQPLLMSTTSMSPGQSYDIGPKADLPRNYTVGDLEESFINAVEKLDFHTTSQQTSQSMANPNRQSLLPGLYQPDPGITGSRHATTVNDASFRNSQPEPCTFAVNNAGLVLMPNNERRPKVNPLRCHPEVTRFSERPVDTSDVSTPPMGTSTPRIEVTKEGARGLENAPIYSPSSGNLSQYARLTPSPARSTASSLHTTSPPVLTPSNLHEMPSYTPTRPSGRTAAAEYAAHKRRRELMGRRSNPQLLFDHGQARMEDNRRNAKAVNGQEGMTRGARESGGNARGMVHSEMQQEPYAKSMEGQRSALEATEGKKGNETMKLSPYRVGNSRRVIGWAPLPASPGYRHSSPDRTTYDHTSDDHLPPPK